MATKMQAGIIVIYFVESPYRIVTSLIKFSALYIPCINLMFHNVNETVISNYITFSTYSTT